MGLKRTQGQKRNCKKGTRKQQNKRTGKRKTAKKNLRRKRQTKRRLKGGGVKRQERNADKNGPNVGEINGSSPPGKIRKKDQNKYLVRGAEGKNNYYLSETNYYSSGSDSEGNSNDEEPLVRRDAMRPMVTPKREEGNKYDNTRGPAQLGYDEVQRAINYQENVNSGLYSREELEEKYKRT
tara:strand:- start:314 stop:856 length:543 start_codon:yes stop_codon:yes gene_type:complete